MANNDYFVEKRLKEMAMYNTEKLMEENETLKANLDYIAMMTDVEIPESEVE